MIKHVKNTWMKHFKYNEDMIIRLKNMLSLVNMNKIHSVVDLGCGIQYLRDILDEYGWTGKYIGLNLYQHKESTIICDFNKDQIPLDGHYDLIVIAGLLEYIYDIHSFLNKVKNISGKYILLSYIFDEFAKKRANIWTPLLSQKTILDIILDKQEFSLMKVVPDPVHPEPNTTLYMLFKKTENM